MLSILTEGYFEARATYASFVPGGLERDYPDAYTAMVEEGCLVPIIHPGDKLLISPTVSPQPGQLVMVRSRHDDGAVCNYVKRLLHPIPFIQQGKSYVAVEMFDPPKRFGIAMFRVLAAHAIVGLSRQGKEPFRTFSTAHPTDHQRGRLQ